MKPPILATLIFISSLGLVTAPSMAGLVLDVAEQPSMGETDKVTITELSTGGTVGTLATFAAPSSSTGTDVISMAFDQYGNLFVLDYFGQTIKEITPSGIVTTFSSGWGNDVDGLAFSPSGTLYATVSDDRILKFAQDGSFTTFATIIPPGQIPGGPTGLTFDPSGNLFVTMRGDNAIVKVAPDGSASTFVSTGLSSPYGITADSVGNLFVADQGDGKIQMVTPEGIVSTFASIQDSHPVNLAFGPDGNLYVTDHFSSVFEVTPSGVVSTFATGLNDPIGLAINPVPEPSTLVMSCIGAFVMLGCACLSRKGGKGVKEEKGSGAD